jgi:hypothetical protein
MIYLFHLFPFGNIILCVYFQVKIIKNNYKKNYTIIIMNNTSKKIYFERYSMQNTVLQEAYSRIIRVRYAKREDCTQMQGVESTLGNSHRTLAPY